jgi:hypothetical protein
MTSMIRDVPEITGQDFPEDFWPASLSFLPLTLQREDGTAEQANASIDQHIPIARWRHRLQRRF